MGGATQANADLGHHRVQVLIEPKEDGKRFYISRTSGYRTITGSGWEQEYAVVDRDTTLTVALFIVSRGRKETEEDYAKKRRDIHLRARQHCRMLNEQELAVPAADVETRVGGELVEGLVLDNFPSVRRGDYLPSADVHDDMAAPA